MKEKNARSRLTLPMVCVNVVCMVLIAALFLINGREYREKLYAQNISSAQNLNRSSATAAQALFSFRSQKVRDAARYIEKNGMDRETALAFLGGLDSDPTGSFELIGADGSGFLAGDSAEPVSYRDSSYGELQRLFRAAAETETIAYSPEFTDAATAFKSFAFYTYVVLRDGAAETCETLMFVSRSDDSMEMIQQQSDFEGLSAVLIDAEGNYILGNPDFKSENFFQYLYVFNDLTLDERNALAAEVQGTDSGVLTYRNSAGADCVFLYDRPAGEAWYSVSCVPLSSFPGSSPETRLTAAVTAILLILLVTDILWLNSLNRRLKLSAERERQANAAKTEFLSRMSHDIRTPLNAILGFAEISRRSPDLAPEVRDSLAKIDTSGHYLLGIINDVLDMSKIESGKVELHAANTDCAALFSEVAEIFSGEARRRQITLQTEISVQEHRYLILDGLRTKRIFSNLLSNAIKFSDSGSVVVWTVTEEKQEDGRIRVVSKVRDHGCGMSPEFVGKLFEPFSQEQNPHSSDAAGTGLGLAIVSRLVQMMDGSVEVESEQGRGTEFTVTLCFPEGENGTADAVPDGAEQRAAMLRGKRALICEDNTLNREIASALLTEKGMRCETAENGKLGVERFSASPEGYFDVVLMDVRMPVMNGLEAAAAIRRLDRADASRVPILAMTANAYDEDIRECLAAGMNAHLAKPFEPDVLFGLLVRFLAKE